MQRILIVDDERVIAETLCQIFKQRGYDARAAFSAEEAMECARTFKPALLLSDLSMPGDSGVQLATTLEREIPGCRIMILTGNREDTLAAAARTHRDWRFLTKPIKPDVLLRNATEVLNAA